MATIAILHVPLTGHTHPLGRLGRVLARHGHRVVAWVTEDLAYAVEGDGVEVRATGNAWKGRSGVGMTWVASVLAEQAVASTEAVVELLHAEEPDLVIFDSMAPWGRIASKWLGVPSISSCAGAWPMTDPPGPGDGIAGPPDPEHLRVIEKARREIGRRWGIELGGTLAVLGNVGDLNLGFTTPEILGIDLGLDAWRLIGPLFGPPSAREEPALDGLDERPLVFFSLGTVFGRREDLFRAAVTAFADDPVQVLVGTSSAMDPAVLGPLPANVRVTHRLGVQRTILERADVFISHCGAGSTHEALAAGVPVAGLPLAGDQPFWSRRLEELGAGRTVPDETPEAMRETVLELLRDEAFRRRARELGEQLAGFDGEPVALGAVEELAG